MQNRQIRGQFCWYLQFDAKYNKYVENVSDIFIFMQKIILLKYETPEILLIFTFYEKV